MILASSIAWHVAAKLCQSRCALTIWLTSVLGVISLASATLRNWFNLSLGSRKVTQVVDCFGNVTDFKANRINVYVIFKFMNCIK